MADSNTHAHAHAGRYLPFVLTSSAALLFSGCPGGVQVTPGSTTAAGAASGSVTLSWSAPTTDTDGEPVAGLAGYRIYMGADPSDLALRAGVSGAASTSFEVSGLAPGTYYFAVTAYNDSGTESEKSNIGSKTL